MCHAISVYGPGVAVYDLRHLRPVAGQWRRVFAKYARALSHDLENA